MKSLFDTIPNTLETLKNVTGIESFDVSNSEVVVANYTLTDYTRVVVSVSEVNKVETGIDPNYHAPVGLAPTTTIEISLIADSDDCKFLESLQEYILTNNGYFHIVIMNNSRFAGTYSCYFTTISNLIIDQDPDDEIFTFGAIREDKGVYSRLANKERLIKTLYDDGTLANREAVIHPNDIF